MKQEQAGAAPLPSTLAVAGASGTAGTVGERVWRRLDMPATRGRLFAVNHRYGELTGAVVYGRVCDLPVVPELAIICAPAPEVAPLVADFGALGTRRVMVATEGLDAAQRQAVAEAAARFALSTVDARGFDALADAFVASQPPTPAEDLAKAAEPA